MEPLLVAADCLCDFLKKGLDTHEIRGSLMTLAHGTVLRKNCDALTPRLNPWASREGVRILREHIVGGPRQTCKKGHAWKKGFFRIVAGVRRCLICSHRPTQYHIWERDRCVICNKPRRGTHARFLFDFWRHVNKTETCWLWTGRLDRDGYGQADPYWVTRRAHRVAWTLLVGKIPSKLEPDHLCEAKHCVNPAHMQIVTRAENVRRAVKKPYCKRGHEQTKENRVAFPSAPGGRCRLCIEVLEKDRRLV